MAKNWTDDREAEFQELSAKLRALQNEREGIKQQLMLQINEFVKNELGMSAGSSAFIVVQEVMFKHRAAIIKFYEGLPQLAERG